MVLKIGAKEFMLQTGFYTLKIWVANYQLMRQAALQELRIQYGWQAIEAENEALEQAKVTQIGYEPEVLEWRHN